jgi:hypothetical protein
MYFLTSGKKLRANEKIVFVLEEAEMHPKVWSR